ncbi:hypothetical protein CJ739_2320 [Mariniflexile rhizosphaerae]|uniref:hypothetical protein n=1 Tax=unclassified Mariniflexile TaxID=2643887 RepID=UPI000CC3CAD9|nr:hypothetical protein [Mariniflexile sp. TRM1-10]AXP81394.1 hypothetical protein CJ739_2320 [Mariniflexile sp. TRM1-10]PLB18506.1 MAG: hypothetical protein TRG1_2659 [Flavobacteriaceae bacterium FS1-H7996/R]
MKAKWCISTLIFIFTLLGVASHQQAPVPNQEIVLQFAQLEGSSNQAKNTIAIVKKQLQIIGVNNIQVEEQAAGSYKISYYSNTDVAHVKKILSEEKELALGKVSSNEHEKPAKSPSEKQATAYNLDVFEIQKHDANTGFGGKCALELKYDYNRFFIPIVSVPTQEIAMKNIEDLEKGAYKFQKNVALAIDNTSYKIPEVRAGPNC